MISFQNKTLLKQLYWPSCYFCYKCYGHRSNKFASRAVYGQIIFERHI